MSIGMLMVVHEPIGRGRKSIGADLPDVVLLSYLNGN